MTQSNMQPQTYPQSLTVLDASFNHASIELMFIFIRAIKQSLFIALIAAINLLNHIMH